MGMMMKNPTPLLNPRPKTEISDFGRFYPHLGFDLPIADRSHPRSDAVLTNPTSGVAVTYRLNPPKQERVTLIRVQFFTNGGVPPTRTHTYTPPAAFRAIHPIASLSSS
jgi:hypothetical protein